MMIKSKIKIKKMNHPSSIIEYMIMFYCIMGTLQLLGAPHVIEYVLDILCILLLINIFNGQKIRKIISNPVIGFQLLLIVAGILIAIFNSESVFLIFWSLRNFGRFLVFFGACICYLNYDDYKRIFLKLNYLYYINFAMVLLEFFVMKLSDDAIGGIFGATQTTNGDLNVFLLIMTIYYVVIWNEGEKKTFSLIGILAIDFIICILAELKFFFFEMPAILVLFFLITRILSGKKIRVKWIGIIVGGILLLIIGIAYLGEVYEYWKGFFTIEKILEEVTRDGGYTNRGDINRLTFLDIINDRVFRNSFFERLVGIGLGGAEFSGISDLFTSSFYNRYEYLHYYYFSLSWMYVECGYIGMSLYLSSFVVAIYKGFKRLKTNYKHEFFLIIGILATCMSILLLIYNQSMRLPSAYLMYFCIACVFCKKE